MKRLLISLLVVASLLSMASCKCAIEKQAIDNVSGTHDLIAPKFLKYVDNDPALNARDKEDWKLLVEKDKKNIEALKKAVE